MVFGGAARFKRGAAITRGPPLHNGTADQAPSLVLRNSRARSSAAGMCSACLPPACARSGRPPPPDRKSTRLNSSHLVISYAVFCLKKKKKPIFLSIFQKRYMYDFRL